MTSAELFLVFLLAIIAAVTIIQCRKYGVQRALKLPKNPPKYSDDAIKEAKAIGIFLHQRANACGVYFHKSGEATGLRWNDVWDIGKNSGVVTLVRLCHYLGCEIIIRQIDTKDIECEENTKEVIAEYISRLDEKYR